MSWEKGKRAGLEKSAFEQINLANIPNFKDKPVSILTKMGSPIGELSLERAQERPALSPEVDEMKRQLAPHEGPGFFNGPMLNVERVDISKQSIRIKTGTTDLFSYLASSAHFEGREGENSVRPLAVQATVFSPRCEHVLLERRSAQLADFPNKLSEFGGALNDKDTDLVEAMRLRIEKKWGIPVTREQIVPTGLLRENAGNIYCASFAVELTEEQFKNAYETGRDASADESGNARRFYMISTGGSFFSKEQRVGSIEQVFIERRGIEEWNYLGFYNMIVALVAKGLRTKDEGEAMLDNAEDDFRNTEHSFEYPAYRYLRK